LLSTRVAGPERRDRQRDLFRRQHLIDAARPHGAERHPVELRRLGALAEHRPARLADFLHGAGAVTAAARQDDGHGPVARVLRERA